MKKILLLTAVVLGACLLFGSTFISKVTVVEPVTAQAIEIPKRYVPTHAQNVWLHALEWCESRGKISAINPSDADGTPSYSSFQWKPSTFKYYAVKYNLLKGEDVDTDEEVMENMFNRDIQISIITEMIGDKSIKWNIQFPDCTKNKIGIPPNY